MHCDHSTRKLTNCYSRLSQSLVIFQDFSSIYQFHVIGRLWPILFACKKHQNATGFVNVRTLTTIPPYSCTVPLLKEEKPAA
jgi:hypothetical protein